MAQHLRTGAARPRDLLVWGGGHRVSCGIGEGAELLNAAVLPRQLLYLMHGTEHGFKCSILRFIFQRALIEFCNIFFII